MAKVDPDPTSGRRWSPRVGTSLHFHCPGICGRVRGCESGVVEEDRTRFGNGELSGLAAVEEAFWGGDMCGEEKSQ